MSDFRALVAEIRARRHIAAMAVEPASLTCGPQTTPSCSDCSKQGAFQRDTPTAAFKVQVRQPDHHADRHRQRLVNIAVGFASLKAEFGIITIMQLAG
jgi:hypothetical protein